MQKKSFYLVSTLVLLTVLQCSTRLTAKPIMSPQAILVFEAYQKGVIDFRRITVLVKRKLIMPDETDMKGNTLLHNKLTLYQYRNA